MANKGTIPGLNSDGWRNYDIELQGSSAPGSPVPSRVDLGNSEAIGRYYKTASGFCCVQFYFKFGSTFVPGDAENLIVKVPFPGNRWSANLSVATADIPIGTGLIWEGNTDNTAYASTIAAGSNGVNTNTFLGAGTLNVNSTSGATQNGTITVATGGTPAVISYSGLTATTFTGCNTLSGGGSMSTSGSVAGTTGISKVLPLIPTQADPLNPIAQRTQEDYWAHFFIQHSKNTGTGTIAQGNSSQVVTHNLGLTPLASDIVITPTGNPTTNPMLLSVTSITSTQFTVAAGQTITSGTVPFSWKAMVEPNASLNFPQLLNYKRPWTLGPGHVFSGQLVYETRF